MSAAPSDRPPRAAFSPAERRLIGRLPTPAAVQAFLNALPYNTEPPPGRATLRSFRGVVRAGRAHCLEAALSAAAILEQHGYPPLLLSLESIDELDHVLFIYRSRGRWGSVARSRDPGLHGRRPVFRTLRDLARSYCAPYVDRTGAVRAYGAADLRDLGRYDWRFASTNVWKVERHLFDVPHRPVALPTKELDRLRRAYLAFVDQYPGRKPLYYDRSTWTPIPAHFDRAARRRDTAL